MVYPSTDGCPSNTNLAAHSQNSQPVDHKSDVLTTTPLSHHGLLLRHARCALNTSGNTPPTYINYHPNGF